MIIVINIVINIVMVMVEVMEIVTAVWYNQDAYGNGEGNACLNAW